VVAVPAVATESSLVLAQRKLADAVPEAPARNIITLISSAVVPLAARAPKAIPNDRFLGVRPPLNRAEELMTRLSVGNHKTRSVRGGFHFENGLGAG
jgi:hypothetical protein